MIGYSLFVSETEGTTKAPQIIEIHFNSLFTPDYIQDSLNIRKNTGFIRAEYEIIGKNTGMVANSTETIENKSDVCHENTDFGFLMDKNLFYQKQSVLLQHQILLNPLTNGGSDYAEE